MPNVNTKPSTLSTRHALNQAMPTIAHVQQRVVAEQRDMIAGARRHEHGREEAAENAEHCERARILQHGQHAGRRRDGHEQRERERGRQEVDRARNDAKIVRYSTPIPPPWTLSA